MKKFKEKKKILIVLTGFATVFTFAIAYSLGIGEKAEVASAAELTGTTTIITGVTEETPTIVYPPTDNTVVTPTDNVIVTPTVQSEDTTIVVPITYDETDTPALTAYTVVNYEMPVTLYTSDTVNVRAGAGTDYERIGKVGWGTAVPVVGATSNGWYQVLYDNMIGFIRGDYMVAEVPGIPYLFVGDSRTVQMQLAVGTDDKAYIAKVGEGYNYFKNTAIDAIPQYAGRGTTMIINFGVNDLRNASKYVQLVNSHMDEWTEAGITVYYSAVTPVGSSASVSNGQIEAFNTTLKDGLDSRVHWIDSYSYLQQVGFSSKDGLHYNKETYKNLYSYYMAVISQGL
ncbi:MAG: SH3 domain-containing protein [Butyrivibrio sp.]|nr:SH3 domain-containing protein [Butyrivibrio sp.]